MILTKIVLYFFWHRRRKGTKRLLWMGNTMKKNSLWINSPHSTVTYVPFWWRASPHPSARVRQEVLKTEKQKRISSFLFAQTQLKGKDGWKVWTNMEWLRSNSQFAQPYEGSLSLSLLTKNTACLTYNRDLRAVRIRSLYAILSSAVSPHQWAMSRWVVESLRENVKF